MAGAPPRLMTFAAPALSASESGWRWHATRGATVAAVLCGVVVNDPWRAFDAPGRSVLVAASVMMFAAAVLVGVAGGMGVVEDARGEGRLPLLQLAEYRGWRLALNLLAGVLSQSVLLTLLLLPVGLLSVTLGGVTAADVLENGLVTAAAAVAAVGAGVFAAAFSTRPAMWLCVVAGLFALPEILYAVGLWPTLRMPVRPFARTFGIMSGDDRLDAALWLIAGGVCVTFIAGWRLLRAPEETASAAQTRRPRGRLSGDPHVWRVRNFDSGGARGRLFYKLLCVAIALTCLVGDDDALVFMLFALIGVAGARLSLLTARRVRSEADGGEVLRLTPGSTERAMSVAIASARTAWFPTAAAAATLLMMSFAERERFGWTVAGILIGGGVTDVFAARVAGLTASRRSASAAAATGVVAGILAASGGFAIAASMFPTMRSMFGSLGGTFATGLFVGLPAAIGLPLAGRFEPDELHVRHAIRGARRRDIAVT